MIDLHCHILPGVDDGAKTIDDSVAMARMAAAAGTKVICATPHMLHPQYHVPGDVAKRKVEEVRAAVKAAGIDLEIVLAGEIHWSTEIPERLASGEVLPYCEERKYILFELPMSHVPHATREVMWKFQMAGIFPVLAHPERNADFESNPDLIHEYRDAGIPCQITAMSLVGDFGRRARKVAERWLAEGSIDLLASDGHSARGRPPTLADAARIVRKQRGSTLEDWVTREVPRRILAGEPVLG
jgi:protein-tyrosine phosphatase